MESLSETDEGRLDDRILESIKTIVKTTYNLWVQHPMASASPIPLYNGAECQLDEDADLSALRAQLRSAPDGLAAYDTALRCIHVSDAVARYGFGRRPDEIVGRMLCDAAPDVAPTLEPLLRHVLETDEPLARVEFSGETPSAPGQVWYWLGDIYPLRNSVGKTIGVGVLGMDEKQGKRAEDKQAEFVVRERSATQRLAFLATASQLVAASRDYEDIARRVAKLSVPILGAWCAVHALENGRVRLIAHASAAGTDDADVPPALRTYLSEAAHDGPPAVAQVVRTGMSLRFPSVAIPAWWSR